MKHPTGYEVGGEPPPRVVGVRLTTGNRVILMLDTGALIRGELGEKLKLRPCLRGIRRPMRRFRVFIGATACASKTGEVM